MMRPSRRLLQIRVTELAHAKHIFYVHIHNAVKLVHGEGFGPALKGGPGVVHKKIQTAAVLCCNLIYQCFHGGHIADIAFQVDDSGRAFAHALLGRSCTADGVDRGTVTGQHVGNLKSDAAASSRDNTHFIL